MRQVGQSYLSVKMIEAAMGGEEFYYPVGTYANTARYDHVMMAMPTRVTSDGVYTKPINGTAEEIAALDASYKHLQGMRDQVIAMGAMPAVEDWSKINPNL